MAESPKRFAVGYAIPPKKQESFIQPSLLRLARDRGLDLIPIDPSRPLSDQGPFHCIIHKLYTDEWKAQVRLHASHHPGVPIVDDPSAIDRLHNRISMLEVVSHLELPQGAETLGIPRQAVVYDSNDSLSDPGALRFPVIAKPLAADGSAKSHKMALLFHPDELRNLNPPVVLQEFVNHGGVIFKVYVVGDSVTCVKRKSLPDVSKEMVESSEGSLSFSQVSNRPMPPDQAEEDLEAAEMPPESFVTEIARGLGRAMGLRLFNFDMIRDAEAAGHYLTIDINYFPGYAKMPAYETVLTDFFLNLVRKKREDEKEEIF